MGSRAIGLLGADLIDARNRHLHLRRWALLHTMFIWPAYRRAGIARLLIRRALRWAQRRGAAAAKLEMAAPNRAARALYEDFGFSVQEVMMACRLPQSGHV